MLQCRHRVLGRAARLGDESFAECWCYGDAGDRDGQHPWDNVWLWASTSITSLVASALLPCEDTSFEEVCRAFLLRFWEGRKAGWSADTCWERGVCKASRASFKDSQSSLNSFEALCGR